MTSGFPKDFHLGDLRFVVTLATRVQTADPLTANVIMSFVNPMTVYASITPIGLATWIANMQINPDPITHLIRIRWLDRLDQFDVVLREIISSDGSGTRQEIYRIRKLTETGGRQRFLELMVELEARDYD